MFPRSDTCGAITTNETVTIDILLPVLIASCSCSMEFNFDQVCEVRRVVTLKRHPRYRQLTHLFVVIAYTVSHGILPPAGGR